MITTTQSRETYNLAATGATYSTNFKVFSKDEIECKLVRTSDDSEVALTIDVHYTIDGVLSETGQEVDLSLYEALNNISTWTSYDGGNWQLSIRRNMSPLQELDYNENDDFPAESHETALDRLTALVQDALSGVTGSITNVLGIKFPDNEPAGTSPELPSWTSRLGKLAGWDSVTGEWEAVDLDADNLGGMTGPANQTQGNLAIYSATQGGLEEQTGIDVSRFETQTLVQNVTDGLPTPGETGWNLSNGHIATINLTQGQEVTLSNIKAGQCELIVNQDGTGGRQLTFSSDFLNADSISLNTDANAITTLTFVSNGTNLIYKGSSAASKSAAGDVGTYRWFAYDIATAGPGGTSIEDDVGYLVCNGQAVSRTKYADLFAAIGEAYGAGDGSTTFELPDLTTDNRFIRSSTSAGTTQNQEIEDHRHYLSVWNACFSGNETNAALSALQSAINAIPGGSVSITLPSTQIRSVNYSLDDIGGNFTNYLNETSGASGSSTFDSNLETRPINISAIPAIKF
jgi:microcystin-dependent protein